jgi:hypothetical protein
MGFARGKGDGVMSDDTLTFVAWAIIDRKDVRKGEAAPYIGNGRGRMPDLYRTRKDAVMECIYSKMTPLKVVVTVDFGGGE